MADKWQKAGRERVLKRGSVQYATDYVDLPARTSRENSVEEVGSLHKLVDQRSVDAALARALADTLKEFGG